MKKVILSLMCVGFLGSLYAEDMGVVEALADVAKTKIQEDAKTARANRSEVKIDNSEINAKAEKGNDNVVVGIDGSVVAVGEQVEISNSEISAESKMGNDNVVVGVTGSVALGAK